MKRFFLQSRTFFILMAILFLGPLIQPFRAASSDTVRKLQDTREAIVTSREAWQLIQKNTGNPGFIILDVRTPMEFFNKRIPGAINIDFYSPEFKRNLAKLDREKTYLVYCKSGVRSQGAISLMKTMKFKAFFHLTGGILEWVKEGMPTQSGP